MTKFPKANYLRSGELQRKLGLWTAIAVVAGDMLGSGIFFTPGELAAYAPSTLHVYLIWGICGLVILCGALTLAELTAIFPEPGASYYIIREGFGSFPAFIKIWIEMLVSGPGSVAGIAIILGDFAVRIAGGNALYWATGSILFFAAINLTGVQWGGRTQITLTLFKIFSLLALIGGSLYFAKPVMHAEAPQNTNFFKFIGMGIAVVLFTYDGWIDVSHLAGEVREPSRTLPRALGFGVLLITMLYLLVNFAFLRVVPLHTMRSEPQLVATRVSVAAFGNAGGNILNLVILISILGALGGLILTLPRLFYAGSHSYRHNIFFRMISLVNKKAVPSGSTIYCAIVSIMVLFFFRSFSRIVNFFVVPVQVVNILLICAIFRFHKKNGSSYSVPGYPYLPLIYVVVLAAFLVSAIVFNPLDCLLGIAFTAIGIPVYYKVARASRP